MYANLVRIKEQYYGKESEVLITPLKNLGQVQAMGKKPDEAIETFEKGI
jgi:hypothetical protein